LRSETFESQVQKGAAFVGSVEEVADQVAAYDELIGGFDTASLQVNFNDIALADAQASMRLFGEKVLPRLSRV